MQKRKCLPFHPQKVGTICMQSNISMFSRQIMERHFRNEADHAWAFSSATVPSLAETESASEKFVKRMWEI